MQDIPKRLIDAFGNVGNIDDDNPLAPGSLYTIKERESPINGRRMERIPENKNVSLFKLYSRALKMAQLIILWVISWTDSIIWSDAVTI